TRGQAVKFGLNFIANRGNSSPFNFESGACLNVSENRMRVLSVSGAQMKRHPIAGCIESSFRHVGEDQPQEEAVAGGIQASPPSPSDSSLRPGKSVLGQRNPFDRGF